MRRSIMAEIVDRGRGDVVVKVVSKAAELPSGARKCVKGSHISVIPGGFEGTRVVLYLWLPHLNEMQKHWNHIDENWYVEYIRRSGADVVRYLRLFKHDSLSIEGIDLLSREGRALVEGIVLSSYQFTKYRSEPGGDKIKIHVDRKVRHSMEEDINVWEGIMWVRDMVNEPFISLNSEKFVEEIRNLFKGLSSVKVRVLEKKEIEKEGMGGLLAVNRGSQYPPYFVILEYAPAGASKEHLVLAGKGIVYDTGGLSLKPTPNSMDEMKCDMAGAATVAGVIFSIAKNNLKVKCTGLIPITDNWPAGKSYAPGDVIRMHNGKYVEVLNTDAEGRLILADALSYARKLKPSVVIDIATLTGAARRAVGDYSIVGMGTLSEQAKKMLMDAGMESGEPITELPLFDDYFEDIKSSVADVKNIGKDGVAGAIIGGKFLEYFTLDEKGKPAYEWYHLDIASMAFFRKGRAYYPDGATGVPLRTVYKFIKKWSGRA